MSLTKVNFIWSPVMENTINISYPFRLISIIPQLYIHLDPNTNKNINVFLEALMFSNLHSSPGWSMMEQHRDIICHYPLSLPCWYSDTACHLLDYLSVTNVWLKQLAYRKTFLKRKKRWWFGHFYFYFPISRNDQKWPTLHKSCLLWRRKSIAQSPLTCKPSILGLNGCLRVLFRLCSLSYLQQHTHLHTHTNKHKGILGISTAWKYASNPCVTSLSPWPLRVCFCVCSGVCTGLHSSPGRLIAMLSTRLQSLYLHPIWLFVCKSCIRPDLLWVCVCVCGWTTQSVSLQLADDTD